ncbi:hypothetical protein DINM_000204 [Dirofilaria immitis]|nr:hypothetical protein [Dirofilaria immitis]
MSTMHDMKLTILVLLVTICPSLSSYCEEWYTDNYPEFVLNLSKTAKEEFCELLESMNGTAIVKKSLMDILQLQLRMDIPPTQMENQIDDMIQKLPDDMQNEAHILWNMLHPANIYDDY